MKSLVAISAIRFLEISHTLASLFYESCFYLAILISYSFYLHRVIRK